MAKILEATYILLDTHGSKKIKQYNCPTDTVLQLRCFDGKSLEFIEKAPGQYDGYDCQLGRWS